MVEQTNAEPVVASEVAPTETKTETKADISQGYLVGVEEPKTEPVVKEPKAAEEPVDDKAVAERLKQQNARQAKLLSSLGIDPLGDLAEQLESGLITEEMVKQHVLGRPEQKVAAPTATDPLSVAKYKYDTAKAAYDKEAESGGITIQTNNAYLNAIQGLNEAKLDSITQQITADRTVRQANENVERVLNVARSVPEYAEMDDGLRGSVDMVNVAVTGIIADREARKLGLDPAMLTPNQYEYFAKKASAELKTLADYYVEKGRQQAKSGLLPQNVNKVTPVPASSGEGTVVPPVNPYEKVTHANHQDAARQFIKDTGVV